MNKNEIAEVFFGTILGEAKRRSVSKLLERYPEITLKKNHLAPYNIEAGAKVKLGEKSFSIFPELKAQYDAIVAHEVCDIINDMIREKK